MWQGDGTGLALVAKFPPTSALPDDCRSKNCQASCYIQASRITLLVIFSEITACTARQTATEASAVLAVRAASAFIWIHKSRARRRFCSMKLTCQSRHPLLLRSHSVQRCTGHHCRSEVACKGFQTSCPDSCEGRWSPTLSDFASTRLRREPSLAEAFDCQEQAPGHGNTQLVSF